MSGIINSAGSRSGIIAAGRATPAFAVYRSSNMTGLNAAGSTWIRVNYDTEIFDSHSAYSHNASYDFVVPPGFAGYYLFNASCRWTAGGGSNSTYDRYALELRVGNVSKAKNQWFFEPDIQNAQTTLQHLINLSEADSVDIYAQSDQGGGATASIGGNAEFETRFTGTYLGI